MGVEQHRARVHMRQIDQQLVHAIQRLSNPRRLVETLFSVFNRGHKPVVAPYDNTPIECINVACEAELQWKSEWNSKGALLWSMTLLGHYLVYTRLLTTLVYRDTHIIVQ